MRDVLKPLRDRGAGARGRERATAIGPGGDLWFFFSLGEEEKILACDFTCQTCSNSEYVLHAHKTSEARLVTALIHHHYFTYNIWIYTGIKTIVLRATPSSKVAQTLKTSSRLHHLPSVIVKCQLVTVLVSFIKTLQTLPCCFLYGN